MADEALEGLQMQSESVPICQFLPMGASLEHRAKDGEVEEMLKEIPRSVWSLPECMAELTEGSAQGKRAESHIWNYEHWSRVQRKFSGNLKSRTVKHSGISRFLLALKSQVLLEGQY